MIVPLTGEEDLLYRDLSYVWVNSWGFVLTKDNHVIAFFISPCVETLEKITTPFEVHVLNL